VPKTSENSQRSESRFAIFATPKLHGRNCGVYSYRTKREGRRQ
jgi:hypothetical protein